jgi:MarR family 2-MHQ and catechol resistance regulon transcriptional repressor
LEEEDVSQALFRTLLRTLGHMRGAMEPFFAAHGISGPQWGALRVLSRAGAAGEKGLRLSELAGRLLIRPPSVTAIVDRLERRGLVKRTSSRTDMRVREARLTGEGRRLVGQISAGHGERIRSLFAGLDADQRGNLLDGLRKLDAQLEKLAPGNAARV